MRRLIEAGKTVATAESCTGGMIGELLTRVPGSSRAFLGGAIVYSNAEKIRQLGVRAGDARRARRGQRSRPCARWRAARASGSAPTSRSRSPGSPAPTAARRTSRSARCGSRSRARPGSTTQEARAGRARAIRSARWPAWWALRARVEPMSACEAGRATSDGQAAVRRRPDLGRDRERAGGRGRDAGAAGPRRRRRHPLGRAGELSRDAEVPRLDRRRRDRRGRAMRSAAATAGDASVRVPDRAARRVPARSTRRPSLWAGRRGRRRARAARAARSARRWPALGFRARDAAVPPPRDDRAAARNSTRFETSCYR